MRLMHYSDHTIESVHSVGQAELPHFKPGGLWVSVQGADDWKQWCAENDFKIGAMAHEVTLAPNASILRITSSAGIDALTARYSSGRGRAFSYHMIDWRRLAAEHQGIIIAPYIWSERLSDTNRWYYAWDCASGCIWDADAIESIRLRVEETTEDPA